MRVAVVWNHDRTGVINQFGQPNPEDGPSRTTIQNIVAALQDGGHETLLCEGDKRLIATLEWFMPPDRHNHPSGIVFNMAYGIQGECRVTHVPAMLEMAGVPYTGSSPLGHGLDKIIAKSLLRDAGVPTPNFLVMRSGTESTGHLRFPMVVKPCHESMSLGLQLVHEPAQLSRAVEGIVTQYGQDALVEEYIEGREVYVALLGNGDPEVLPLVEQEFGDREPRLMTWEAKNMAATTQQRICPAQIGSSLAAALRQISVASFNACQCRDFARIDLRIDRSGRPFVLEINSMPALDPNTAYALAAWTAGHSFSSMVNRILNVAQTRYFGMAAP
ncbi:ATP-grasp domain-containing protein [Mesorhizobium sp. M0510]|uniref:D-alanine--D-alanine ligase family protein n=1 Tax=Mesorhizobium sp. M0510 TaxID=2956954 RepID=UPI00333965D8